MLNKIEIKQLQKLEERIKEYQTKNNYPYHFDFPVTLQFELTAKCNMKCLHCYNRSGDQDKITLMTPEHWKNLCKQIVSHGGIFYCIISGGEPLLLGDELFSIMDILHEDHTVFTLISNGLLWNKTVMKKMLKYNFTRIQISIDAPDKETHDWFRQKDGSWERAVNAAFMISGHGIPLTIATTIIPQNINKMFEMADLAYSLGASSLILGEVLRSGRAAQNLKLMLSDEDRKLMKKNIKDIQKIYGKKMLIQQGASEAFSLSLQKIYPLESAIIRPNGDVRLDCIAPFVIGNVLEDDIASIWQQKGQIVWQHNSVNEYVSCIINKGVHDTYINHVTNDIYL